MSSIKRISIDQLEVGMYITRVNDEWAADAHLKAEGLITRQDTVDKIRSMGFAQLHIDTTKGKDCAAGVPLEKIEQRHSEELQQISPAQEFAAPRVSFNEERESALEIRSRALQLIDDVMHDVKMGRSFDRQAVRSISEDIVGSLFNNPNALASLLRMRDKDQYLLEHSMNVAVLMGILARSLNIARDELNTLVFGALVHDIGKIRVPGSILYKPGRLEPDEWEEMKRHVEYGEQALAQVEGLPQMVRDICAQHHERLDGTGYPLGLSGSQILRHGRMAAVVDVYDAITADRVYHKGMEPTVALKKMLEWSGDHLDRQLVYQLIRCISVYPAGAMVKLASGHLAVVQEINPRQPASPRVRVVYDTRTRKPLKPTSVNLEETNIYGAITEAVTPADYGLDIQDYL